MGRLFARTPLVLVAPAADVAFIRRSLKDARIANPVIVFERAADARRAIAAGTPSEPALFIVDSGAGAESVRDLILWLRGRGEPWTSAPVLLIVDAAWPGDEDLQFATICLRKPVTLEQVSNAAQQLGFVVVTSLLSGEMGCRIIERR